MSFIEDKITQEGITFDDVLLVPAYSDVTPDRVELGSRFSRNLHLDHAGVGVGVLKELWAYKVKKLKALGMNAIRLSHNPGTPAMLDVCDSLGMVVIDENRLMGTNDEHKRLLRTMIERDRNHPSVILWSIGNEEWWIESGSVDITFFNQPYIKNNIHRGDSLNIYGKIIGVGGKRTMTNPVVERDGSVGGKGRGLRGGRASGALSPGLCQRPPDGRSP